MFNRFINRRSIEHIDSSSNDTFDTLGLRHRMTGVDLRDFLSDLEIIISGFDITKSTQLPLTCSGKKMNLDCNIWSLNCIDSSTAVSIR